MHLMLAAHLAWKNSTNDPKRLLVRCAGITFAVVLMFMQNGFRNALFDSNVRVFERIECDIVLKNKSRYIISSTQNIELDHLATAASHETVTEAQPLYIEIAAGYLRRIGNPKRKIRTIGVDPSSDMFLPMADRESLLKLTAVDSALADSKSSQRTFQIDSNTVEHHGENFGELSDRKIRLLGSFQLGIDFSNHGNLLMSRENFLRYFSHRGKGRDPAQFIDYGLIKCEQGTNLREVAREIQSLVGPYIVVQTREDFIRSERKFWNRNTPIGIVFLVGIIIGFVVGMIICYQVLASDIGDHLGEFATLKAMGYRPSFFVAVVVTQAICLSLFSFIPGLAITWLAFQVVNGTTGLVMFFTPWRIATVLCLTVVMCVISGFIALRRLLTADPASLF